MSLGTPQQQQQGGQPPGSPVSLGQIGGRPAELVIAAVLFAGSAIYLLIDVLLKLGDVFDIFDLTGGTRPGLFFLFSVISYVLISLGLLATAWLLVNADPRGRILAVVIGLAWAIAMIASKFRFFVPSFDDDGTALSLILGLVGVLVAAALTFLPGAHAAFSHHPAAPSAGVSASRLALFAVGLLTLIQGAFLIVFAVGESGKGMANGIILVVAALAVIAIAQFLPTRRIELRLALSGLALAVVITSLILGPRYFLIVFLLGVIVVLPFVLWLVSDARVYFGERPLSLGSLAAVGGQTGAPGRAASSRPFTRPGTGALACTSCGAALQEGDAFCSSCGTPAPEPEPDPQTRACPTCGREVAGDAAFCGGCGSRLDDPVSAGPSTCVSCGAVVESDARFCGACGTAVEGRS